MSRVTTKVTIARQDGTVLGSYVLGLGEHVIGRDPDAAVYIDDDTISRQHAKLSISSDTIELEDLDSTSGTFVDGAAVRGRIPLTPGQTVYLSDLYLDIERSGFGELVVGSRLADGRFTLVQKLGQGAMGAVWKAMDRETDQPVALKLLPPEMRADSTHLRDLEREVEKTKALKHPNIVQVGGLWSPEGEPTFVTLEYVEGADLNRVRDDTPHRLLTWSVVQHYMLQLCDALEYAHQQRIAHRDIKPANLLIDKQGTLKLADFGIAASISGAAGTSTMSVLGAGTPSYMGPQQLQGRQPQASDDIYSLGATFYDLLTSRPPFYQGDIMHQVLSVPPTPIEDRLKELGLENAVPGHICSMIMACLQKDQAHRPHTAKAVRQWIENKAPSSVVTYSQVVWGEAASATKPSATRRKKVFWRVAAAGLVLAGVLAFVWSRQASDPTDSGTSLSSLQETKAKAEKGNAESQNNLGRMYADGRGVVKDDVEAVKWFRKAADQGHVAAQFNLGTMYENGRGVAKDGVETVKWFRKAAEQGHAEAQFMLAMTYENGEGVVKDEVEAAKWYRKAADQGHAAAQYNLGRMYAEGRGVAKDGPEAVKWIRKAADQDHAAAQYNLGLLYDKGHGVAQDDVEAVKRYRKAADRGYVHAQYHLALMYVDGRGVAKNDVEAAKLYRKAADQRHAAAQNLLGAMYADGRGVAKDEVEAVKWYRKAADQGNADAQNNLGLMYYHSRGVLKDYVEAVKWWRKAVEQGHADAQSNLGNMYENGRGVPRDDTEGANWYRKAAGQGHAEAQRKFGWMYANGRGVAKDALEAYKWHLIAVAQGNKLAMESIAGIEGDLTPQQRAEGQRWALAWKPQIPQKVP